MIDRLINFYPSPTISKFRTKFETLSKIVELLVRRREMISYQLNLSIYKPQEMRKI